MVIFALTRIDLLKKNIKKINYYNNTKSFLKLYLKTNSNSNMKNMFNNTQHQREYQVITSLFNLDYCAKVLPKI